MCNKGTGPCEDGGQVGRLGSYVVSSPSVRDLNAGDTYTRVSKDSSVRSVTQ